MLKRRVVKIGDRRYRVELPGGDVSEFSYRERRRQWDSLAQSYTDFDPGEKRYLLAWASVFMDSFAKEEDVLLFIIRFGYGISDKHLVPSEIRPTSIWSTKQGIGLTSGTVPTDMR